MSLKLILIFALFFNISFQAKADVIVTDGSKIDNPAVKNMSAKDQWVYLFLTDVCRNGSFPVFRDSISQSFKAGADLWSLDPARLQGYYRRGMTSTHIEAIFSSLATPYALENCYGHMDPDLKAERKEKLLFELMFLDFVGNNLGLITATVGISKLFGAVFSTLNRFAWQPFKTYAKNKWKLNEKQLKWLDRILIAGAIGVPVGHHVKVKYDENKQAEEDEIALAKRKLRTAQEVKSMLAQIDIQITKSAEKEFWNSAKSDMQDQLNRLCRELKQTLPKDNLSVCS